MAEFQLIDETITLIAALEGCELIAYEDVTGYAIGYGSHKHLDGSTVKKGDTITQEEAIKLLKQRVENEFFPHAKRILTNSKINSYQAGAVTSLIYNCDTGNITSKSSVIKAINANPEDPKIKDLFAEWRLSGGKVCEGLCIRRAREYEFYKNKKINMNVPYVYNSNLGGYAVNDESDAVVGNSKNETKYINTNYCASIKCPTEPEPVVGNGDYENYSESGDAMVNNPLVYKGNEAISIVNSLKNGGYNLSKWVFKKFMLWTKDVYCFYLICDIKKGNYVVGKLEVYITDTSDYKVILKPNKININNVKNKINEYIKTQNNITGGKKYDELKLLNTTYEEQYKELKNFIKKSNFSSDFYTYIKDDNEEFQIYCCKNSKINADIKTFESYISQKGNSIFESLTNGWTYYEYDKHFTGTNEVKNVTNTNELYKACIEMVRESYHTTYGNVMFFSENGAKIQIHGKLHILKSCILRQEDISVTVIDHFSSKFNLNISKNVLFLYFFVTKKCVIFNLSNNEKDGLCEVHMNKKK